MVSVVRALLLTLSLTFIFGCSVGPQVDPVYAPVNGITPLAIELHPDGASTRILGLPGATNMVGMIVAENLTAPGESVTVVPDEDAGFSILVPGRPDDIYRLTPFISVGLAGIPIEITAEAEGGPAIDVTPGG